MEQRLFVALKKMNISYHLQDLRCPKCRQVILHTKTAVCAKSSHRFPGHVQVFERHVARTCSCGGQFKNTIPRESFLTKMRIFENISRYGDRLYCVSRQFVEADDIKGKDMSIFLCRHFQMETLHESVSWILSRNTAVID